MVGTRPSIIKLAPVIKELARRGENFRIIHTGQHYSYRMDRLFFEELGIPKPDHRLEGAAEGSPYERRTRTLEGIERVLAEERPWLTVVYGDSDSTLAGALVARKLRIKVGHLEAGLRSHDWLTPEEQNRVLTDHISDYLFAPTKGAGMNLSGEGVGGRLFVTGNTVVDAVEQNHAMARKSRVLRNLGLDEGEYITLTVHREENVDSEDRLKGIVRGVAETADRYGYEIVFPIHPRTKRRLESFNIRVQSGRVQVVEPVGYRDMLRLLSGSRLVMTDSGGLQEEACILNVPAVTLRERTERQETVALKANYVAGVDPDGIVKGVGLMLKSRRRWRHPFGSKVSGKIVDVVQRYKKRILT